MRGVALVLSSLLLACPSAQPAETGFGTGGDLPSSASTSTSSSSTSTSSGSTGGASGSTGTTVAWDLPPAPDFGPVTPKGCMGKIDLVLATSALYTMGLYQDRLLASLPHFAAILEQDLADFNLHVLSANVDGPWHGLWCEMYCQQMGSCGVNAESYVCGSDSGNITSCDHTRGAGLVFNAGAFASNKPCELSGQRFVTSDDPEFAAAFECIAQVGTYGKDPALADAVVDALAPELTMGCNVGFLRSDALLVIVVVMDNNDEESKLSADEFYDRVVAAKGGDPDAVVILGIIAQPGEPQPDCTVEDSDSHLRDVITRFPFHDASGNICAQSYVPFFQQAADSVRTACGSFIPQ